MFINYVTVGGGDAVGDKGFREEKENNYWKQSADYDFVEINVLDYLLILLRVRSGDNYCSALQRLLYLFQLVIESTCV